jgi:hypothetical protein
VIEYKMSDCSKTHPRIVREIKTVTAMIRIFCRDKHQSKSQLCEDCRQLNQYAAKRLATCPFQENKTTCGKCSVHCYKPSMKTQIIEVMRYAGPRMIFHHPFLAVAHLLDEKRSDKSSKVEIVTNKRDTKL